MIKRSEGVKRITLIFSVLLSLGWFVFIIIQFAESRHGFDAVEWVFSVGGLILAYSIPQIFRRIIYWVIDGFRKDKIVYSNLTKELYNQDEELEEMAGYFLDTLKKEGFFYT